MPRQLHLLGPLLCLLAAGCGASTTFTPTAPPPHALTQRPASAVVVLAYWDGSRPAVEIGILSATSDAHTPMSDDRQRVFRQLLKLAATTGCEAILLGPPSEDFYGSSNGTPLFRTIQTASCLVYR